MVFSKVESWQESQQKSELLALSGSKHPYSFCKVNISFRIITLGLLLMELRVAQTSKIESK